MRPLFFWLLLANVAFFAWMQNAPPIGEREPTHMATQINEDKVKVLTPGGSVPATASAPPPAPAAPPPPPPKAVVEVRPKAAEIVCRAYPNIPANLARTLQAEIAQGSVALKASLPQAKNAEDFWVYIPPRASKAAAEKKLEELRQIGIDDAFLIQEAGPHQFAISLGLFRSEDLALQHLAKLGKQGVRSAQMMGRERNRGDSNDKLTLNITGSPTLLAQLEKDNKTLAGIKPLDCAGQ